MSTPRFGRVQKATALVPLALLSGAWTASLAVSSATASRPRRPQASLTAPPSPTEAIEAPASVPRPA